MVVVAEKQGSQGRSALSTGPKSVVPLTSRPADLAYFIFFALHLFTTLYMDVQPLYPARFVPSFMSAHFDSYIKMSNDPLVGGLVGAFGDSAHLAWFRTFVYLEGLFQAPIFVLALRALYTNSRTIYPLLAIYGTQAASSTLACIVHILQTPESTPALVSAGLPNVTPQQRTLLLASYVPFVIIPGIISVDFLWRSVVLVRKGVRAEKWD